MTSLNDSADAVSRSPVTSSWRAVFAIAFSVACLLTAEFLPVSLLTPMAQGLDISEGMAGQSVAVTAFAAIFASLFATSATRGLDRRLVVLGYAVLLILSSLLTAIAGSFTVLLIGRALLGLALGGFWAMAASLAMRLVQEKDVPHALAIVFGGVSIAMVIAAPLGSTLGAVIGWRGVFALAAALGVISLIWQALTVPSLPARGRARPGDVFAVLGRGGVPLPMLAIFAVFGGQFAFFTYIRPFLEQVSGFGVEGVAFVLLVFGLANFFGTSLSSFALRRGLKATLATAPLVLALCALALAMLGGSQPAVTLILAAWGFTVGVVPVAWSTWVTRELGDDAENAGGLQVATIQLANTCGAAAGGLVFDLAGATGPVLAGALLLLASALTVAFGMTTRPSRRRSVAAF